MSLRVVLLVASLALPCNGRQTVSVVRSPNGRGDFAYAASDNSQSAFSNKLADCQGHAVLGSGSDRVGDGFCDDGSYGSHDFACAKFSFDGGDCGVITGIVDSPDADEPEADGEHKAEGGERIAATGSAATSRTGAETCQGSDCSGQSAGNCWCEATCLAFGDCCKDFSRFCSDAIDDQLQQRRLDATNPSCDGLCGGMDVAGQCYCGADCRGYGDCCDDFEDLCGNLTTAYPVGDEGTQRPICSGCSGCCGLGYMAENADGSSCSCDLNCAVYDTCCDDFMDECGAYTVEPIVKCYDCDGTSCIGHERFVGDGVCDDATTTLNFNCQEYSYDGGDCALENRTFGGSCKGECGQLISYFDARRRQLFTPPSTDSCDGLCGKYTESCHCTLDCVDYEDCCDDYEALCATRNPAPGGNWHELPEERHCWCDQSCVSNADCCDDYLAECDAAEGMAFSCDNACGEKRSSGCWCDKICVENNDCCDDYEDYCGCGEYSYEPCAGCTDEKSACNFDPTATVDDGSCTYQVEGFNCAGECLTRVDCEGVCGGPKFLDECGDCVLPKDRGQSADCAGICGGTTKYDACGICGGTKSASQCACPTAGQVRDCAGACNGVKTLNVCGICTSRSNRFSHIDCFGVCFGSGVEDECGVCNGDGTSCQTGFCEEGRVTDCAGVCDGTLVKDNCGICGGNGATRDCAGVCTGPLLEDECGICGGNGTLCRGCTDISACNFWLHATIDDDSCTYPASSLHDCFGKCNTDTDCFGECGGSAVLDECGVCNGFGATCTTPFCQGGKVDCWGECNGGVIEDVCGVCGGDSSVCQGCMDSTACNYNPSAMVPPPVYQSIRNGLDDNGCSFPPDDKFDCFGVCLQEIDCKGICGGPYVLDDCQVCGLNSGSGATCCAYDYALFEGVSERRQLLNDRRMLAPSPHRNPSPLHVNPAPTQNHNVPAPLSSPSPHHPAPSSYESCVGYCGTMVPGGLCFCDAQCAEYADCCLDIADVCGDTFPVPAPGVHPVPGPYHAPSPGSHPTDPNHNHTGVPAPLNNPAPSPGETHVDHPAPGSNHTGPSPFANVPAPSKIYSCEDQCLRTEPIHGPVGNTHGPCYCDKTCTSYQDCCDDFFDFCAPSCINEFCADGVVDCSGACNGVLTFDECLVCGGDGSTCTGGDDRWWCPEGYDCFGICGGNAAIDECNVCGGFGSTCMFPKDTDSDGLFNGEPYCFTGIRDCAGDCEGNLKVDECFICGGDSSSCTGCLKTAACNYDPQATISSSQCVFPPSSTTNCFGYCDGNFDCLGVCAGTKVTDICGVCGGNGASCRKPATTAFCPTSTVDCFGKCKGTAVLDACGVCGGDSDTCKGCTDTSACNYNELASISDTSCEYFVDAPGTNYDNCLGKCAVGFDCKGDCGGSVKYDICGVCGGEAFDVGCDGVCFSGKSADSCGVCGGFGETCVPGYCSGGYSADCFGECGGTAELDLCGVCNGFNKLRDCNGVCFGSSYLDACGICGGDSAECTGCGDYNACNFDLNAVISDDATCLYQVDENFDCWGNCQVSIDCTGLCNGKNELDACGVCGGDSSTCVGCLDSTACNYDQTAVIPKLSLCFYETTLMSCTGVCKHDVDCGGNCDGYLSLDACGVCNGDSSSCIGCTNPAACNYDALASLDDDSCTYSTFCAGHCLVDVDCLGECDGSMVVDECGVCAGFGASCSESEFCAGGSVDCRGECNGGRVVDACGVCEGDTSTCVGCNDEDACNFKESATLGAPTLCTYPVSDNMDCFGNCAVGYDCKGYCGGSSVVDVCGVCGGFGASCTKDYCKGGRIDCAGECAGGRTIDSCGVCGGDDESCTVLDFCEYGIVDCFGYCHCPFQTDDPQTCARPILDLPPPDVCSLFNDGSFEGLSSTKTTEIVTDVGSWSAAGTTYVSASKGVYWGGVAATDGGYFLVLNGDAILNQTAHATHWNYYLLSFDAAARPDLGMGTLYINVDGVKIYETKIPDIGEMQSHSILFQAESDLVTIQFYHSAGGDTDLAVYLDKVSLTLSDQILLDGNFEGLNTAVTYAYTSYLGAWSGSGIIVASQSSAWGGLAAPSGNYFFAEQGEGWLTQSVPTTAGATYVLTFYAAARPGYGMETLNVYIDSAVAHVLELVDKDDSGVIGFQRFKLNFRTTKSLTKIDFHHRVQAGDLSLFLDAISVSPTADLALDGSLEGVTVDTAFEELSNPGAWRGSVTAVRTGNDDWGGILTPAGNYYGVLMAASKLTQSIPTTKGSSYEISFIASCRPDYGMEKMFVIINGLTVYTLVVEDDTTWATHKLNFVAEGSTAIISLYHGPSATGSTNTAVFFDAFEVSPTPDIVVDGGFEGISTTTDYEYTDDYLDMWMGSGVIIYSGNTLWGGLEAPEGNYYVGRQGSGVIQQNLTTVPGQHYELSFHTTARPNFGADILHVDVQGARVYQLKLEDTGSFAQHTLNYQAKEALTLVSFEHVIQEDQNLTVLLDGIVASPTEDIVIDGSFEGLALTTSHRNVSSDEGEVGSWEGSGMIVRSGNAFFGGIKATLGDYFFALPSGTRISQTLQTTIGKHYTVSFKAAPRPDHGAEPLTVQIRNSIVYVLELQDDAEFATHSLNFYANTTTTEMVFSHDESDAQLAILLDEITISESKNLVIDGSFEGLSTTLSYEYMPEGSVGAWVDSGTSTQHVVVASKNGAWGGLAAPIGDYYLVLQRNTDITQTFRTEKGAFYVLSFYVASRPNYGMDTLNIAIDGVSTYSVVGADGVFEKMSYLFVAASEVVEIGFMHLVPSGDKSVFLDGITLVQYNEAAATEDHELAC